MQQMLLKKSCVTYYLLKRRKHKHIYLLKGSMCPCTCLLKRRHYHHWSQLSYLLKRRIDQTPQLLKRRMHHHWYYLSTLLKRITSSSMPCASEKESLCTDSIILKKESPTYSSACIVSTNHLKTLLLKKSPTSLPQLLLKRSCNHCLHLCL